MTTASQHGASGLSIRYNVTPRSTAAPTAWLPRPLSYTHTITTDGGFKTASLSIAANADMVSDWLEYGLGRYVDVFNWQGGIVWQGFVNTVDITDGPLKISLGPVTDISNKVALIYTPVDTTRVPPGAGAITTTGWSSDTTSQGLYGIWESLENTADKSTTSATRTLARWLAENAWPKRRSTYSNVSGGAPQVSLGLVGFEALLEAYYIVEPTATGFYTIDEKLGLILDADPNAILNVDNSSIDANAITYPDNDDMNRTAATVIKDIVSIGDAGDNRYTWGVYEDRKFYYTVAPTTIEYVAYHNAQNMRVQTVGGLPVDPWDLRPGHWIIFPDTMLARAWPTANFNRDPRCAFIEDVTYTAPYTVAISGGQVFKMAQRLARLGLASR